MRRRGLIPSRLGVDRWRIEPDGALAQDARVDRARFAAPVGRLALPGPEDSTSASAQCNTVPAASEDSACCASMHGGIHVPAHSGRDLPGDRALVEGGD
jgi:hypothetical protein